MPPDLPIDTGKLTTGIAQRAIDRILDFAEAKVKEKWAQYKNHNSALFAQYIRAQARRCGLVRTLIYDKQSTNLENIYIPLKVRIYHEGGRFIRKEEIGSSALISLLSDDGDKSANRRTFAGIISAPAGAGKSFFMRNLYMELVNSGQTRIPIFLELRELNDVSPTDVAGMIVLAFRIVGMKLSKEQALDGLRSGMFTILLDGFDELKLAHERHYAREMDRAAEEFPSCPLLVSGRPSELMFGSNYLKHCDLLPLEPDESIGLIEKLQFDESTKASFIGLMKRELFDTHAEFLELPLLCVVMLITYSDAGRISRKTHEFYEDTFNALWSKHDARKQAGYEREKYTGLDKQSFLRLVSAFSASSYIGELFSMRETQLRAHLTTAKQLTGVRASEESFIRDMTISTSLLVVEGNRYRYSHRSFQEYLCAVYVLSLSDESIGRGIDAVSSRYETDAVLNFILSINPERFERAWVAPRLTATMRRINRGRQTVRAYKTLFESPEGGFLRILREIYGMKPGSESLAGAIASWEDMGLPMSKPLANLENRARVRLFLEDITNFEVLSAELGKKHEARSRARDALFEPPTAKVSDRC